MKPIILIVEVKGMNYAISVEKQINEWAGTNYEIVVVNGAWEACKTIALKGDQISLMIVNETNLSIEKSGDGGNWLKQLTDIHPSDVPKVIYYGTNLSSSKSLIYQINKIL